MGILDRFKPQPKWKHADPAIRFAGVQELPESEQDVLAGIARDDADPRVRRAAVSKLGTVTVLGEIVRSDSDETVREEAAGVLLDIALGAYEADEAASLAALDALRGLPPAAAQKQIVLVAKTAKREPVSRAALSYLGSDQKALGTVARRSEHASVRTAALALLADADELMSTAMKSGFRDVAVGALERIDDPASVKAIATRASNQAAARRARAKLRAVEEREAAAAAAEAAAHAAAEVRRRAMLDIVREVEQVAAAAGPGGASRLSLLEARWLSGVADADAGLTARFDAARVAAREALGRWDAERAQHEARARQAEANLAARRALVARVLELSADSAPDLQAQLVAEWQGLPPVEHPTARSLSGEFEAALRAADRRRKERVVLEERLARLTELTAALETLAADERFPATRELRQRARRVRQDAEAASAGMDTDAGAAELIARLRAAEQALATREQAWREAQNAESEQRKRRAQQVLQRLSDLDKVATPSLKALDRAIGEALAIENELDAPGGDAEAQEWRARVAAAREPLQPKATALREADEWQRWANAGVQEQLIAKMEALVAEADAGSAFRKMRDLQQEWKAVAAAPRDRAEALWNRFRAAGDAVRARVEPLRAEQAAQNAQHLARKIELCEKAEALADSTDWIATADALKALQAEWKTVGPAPRRDEQAVWERFRNACNRFFTRRQDDLKERKHAWAANLDRKEALIAKARSLAESTDWEAGFNELKALQAEWKATGPVKKTRSEQVWQEFRGACDAFMERYRTRDSQQFSERTARREAVIAEAEGLAAAVASGAAVDGLVEKVRSLRTGWQQAGQMPREILRPLAARFEQAIGAIVSSTPDAFRHTELDVETNRRHLEQLCERVEKLAGARQPPPPAASPLSVLANQLREALASNTIGGRGDDEAKWKNAEYEVRGAQDAWQRVGFVPEQVAAPLAARFQRAVQRFYGDRRPSGPPARGTRGPVGPSTGAGPRGPRRDQDRGPRRDQDRSARREQSAPREVSAPQPESAPREEDSPAPAGVHRD